ncbi:MAG: hypothetical protein K6B17_07220 [Treponema sp.]|nr:hypothetical protein [Treponema sp.]
MNKKVSIIMAAMLSFSFFAFAKKGVEEKKLGPENSWQEQFDINNHKPGKYNILVTAEDKAGNKSIAGPYNMYIDPESDLPVTGITNPVKNMRVTGNLNIVGTCVDDDKVSEVWLILDGDKEHPVKAQGKEFWSYYLDTTNLFEGPHTIEAYGIDNGNPEAYRDENGKIDQSKVIPKTGHPVKVTWQLDRRAPVTEVQNLVMGQLVSGGISLKGRVRDGNGIKTLEYSLDGGKSYEYAKLKEEKYKVRDEEGLISEFRFDISVNTKDFKDGVATCWFKATDEAGSIGRYAFLYFIDNTKPDVKVVTPGDEEKNGVFTVAGYAKDIIGVKSLTWQWGKESGEFELTPGNPYWVKEVDSRGMSGKQDFIVTATDTMGNVVVVKKGIKLNQEADKPVVTINYPGNGVNVEAEDGTLFVRGIVKDDDGPVSVTYKLDNGEEKTIDCVGVFSAPLPGTLAYGSHSVTVYATDRYGIKGNPVTTTFNSKGGAPEFGKAVYKEGGSSREFKNGLIANPESTGVYEIPVSSVSGLASIDYTVSWGRKGLIPGSVTLKGGEKSAVVSVPVTGEKYPWGAIKVDIKAKDIFGKETSCGAVINLRDLTHMYTDKPGVYFEDSTVSAEGVAVIDKNVPLTGYFAGARLSNVELVPAQKNVEASFSGQTITLRAYATTDEFEVRATTVSGATYSSRKIKFLNQPAKPKLTVTAGDANADKGIPFIFKTSSDRFRVSGNVSDSSLKVKYHILAVKAELANDAVVTSSAVVPASEWVEVPVTGGGNFSVTDLSYESFVDGVSVLEFVAERENGDYASQGVFVKKLPLAPAEPVLDAKGKPINMDSPRVYWLSGKDHYGIALYQDSVKLDKEFKYVRSENLRADEPALTFTVAPAEQSGKPVSYSAPSIHPQAPSKIDARIATISGEKYKSGMSVTLAKGAGKEAGKNAILSITSKAQIKGVSYKITGAPTAGGSNAAGAATIEQKSYNEAEGIYEYEATIPLENLPARITTLEAAITDSKGFTKNLKGTFTVVRSYDIVDSEAKIYWVAGEGSRYDADLEAYVIKNGAPLIGYANVPGPLESAVVRGEVTGLTATVEGNVIKVTGVTDGTYRGVTVRAKAADGGSYISPEVNVIADSTLPKIKLSSPSDNVFVRNKITIAGTASDANGIVKVEYSIQDDKALIKNKDGSTTGGDAEWKNAYPMKSGEFGVGVDLSAYEDGYIPISIRAVDKTGSVGYYKTTVHKDTTPPEVKVILPDAEAVVNGENTILFEVTDAGRLDKYTYTSAGGGKYSAFKKYLKPEEIPVKKTTADDGTEKPVSDRFDSLRTMNSSMPYMRVGTKDAPIDNKMAFTFADDIGNTTTISKYDFKVDEKSDKPVTEIHLPEEMQVVTTDFTISGVVYDDDGPCKVYYKIDKGEYKLISDELASSFKINVPLSSMTDNEHTVSAYSVDVNGVRGEEVVRKFRVSLEEPKGGMTEPEISKTVKETITLKGWASDKNGISKVQISVDNGATFNDAVGTTSWSYKFDTRVIQDGTHVVFIKIWDGYEITGLYSSLINIDNTPPNLNLEFPLDNTTTSKKIFFSGQTTDNINLTNLYITIRSLEGRTIPERLAKRVLEPDEIITQSLDISELNSGFYNIELTGTDAAGNISRVSRNINLDKTRPLAKVSILYPLNGEHCQGEFSVFGTAYSEKEDPVVYTELYIDGRKMEELGRSELTPSGYFKFSVKEKLSAISVTMKDENGNDYTVTQGTDYTLKPGRHSYQTIAVTKVGKRIVSNEQTFIYNPIGPWVTLDNFTYGDFARNRPLLKGKAGYILSEEEIAEMKDKSTPSDRRNELLNRKVKRVWLSFDNGKTYQPVSKEGKNKWEFRVENLDIPAGEHFMLVKAEMYNGANAITRTVVQVDREAPSIKLISPGESGRYNQKLSFEGLSKDDVDLSSVTLTLRKGDKAAYEVPGFIQGLYFDASFWGATLYNVGVGLTAFDGAVKVQVNFGQFTQEQRDSVSGFLGRPNTAGRFGGNVFGGKIIAQLAYLPFRYFFGRDWDWLSATVAIGANFSYFTETGAGLATGEKVPQMLSALLMQVEFPRITVANWSRFRTWAFYVEPQLWFIPSDVAGGDAKKFVYTTSFGIRTSVF